MLSAQRSARRRRAGQYPSTAYAFAQVYPQFVRALNVACDARDPALLVGPTAAWLRRERPLVETHSGAPLVHVALVEIDRGAGTIRRVVEQA